MEFKDYPTSLHVVETHADSLKLPQVLRANVLGVGISGLNLDAAVEQLVRALELKIKGYVCVTGVHGVSEAQQDPAFRQILNLAFLNTPDGMPMVWMGRLQGFSDMGRVYGPDLMLRICEISSARRFTHFFYGGIQGVGEELKCRLEQRFPGLSVVGTYSPPFRPLTSEEEDQLRLKLANLRPDIVWVGLSTPKQEKFMAEHWEKLDATLFIGVGAAFDFHAGRIRQAPRWMQRSGLEWLFRLACEPRRLWKRYLKNNPLFVLLAICQLIGLRKYRLDATRGDP
jgi:N-acetylglucosaminyldiphosphoundecaprenol N-acetyl-beta-D-mannosaminyltransferase